MYKFSILLDKSNNWLSKYIKNLNLENNNVTVKTFYNAKKIPKSNVLFILGYTKKVEESILNKNKLNLVVHESKLPHGRGFSPVQWQILEGKKKIYVTLIEAQKNIDSGDIILQSQISFRGTELYDEIRFKQANATIQIIKKFAKNYPNYKRTKQKGKITYYPRRTPKDSKLNIDKTILDNFNLLRINNNNSWPSYLIYKKKKYILKIYNEKKKAIIKS